jgi:hypothetical protein
MQEGSDFPLMNKLFMKTRLYNLRMQEGSDLQQHVNVFDNIITKLVKLGVKIDDEDKGIILLCSLSGSNDYLVTTLERQYQPQYYYI